MSKAEADSNTATVGASTEAVASAGDENVQANGGGGGGEATSAVEEDEKMDTSTAEDATDEEAEGATEGEAAAAGDAADATISEGISKD